jgi:hypothetical protein
LKINKSGYIMAWAFTLGALGAGIYNAATGKGGTLCALLLTFALILQISYGRSVKAARNKDKDFKIEPFWKRRKK